MNNNLIDGEPKGKPARHFWHRRNHHDMLAQTAGITNEEYGVWTILLDLLFAHDGSIPDDLDFVRYLIRCNNATKWRRIRANLLERGKLYVEGNTLRSVIVDEELRETRKKREANTKLTASISTQKTNENKAPPYTTQHNTTQHNNKEESSYGYGLKDSKEFADEGREGGVNVTASATPSVDEAVMQRRLAGLQLAHTVHAMPRGRA